MTDSNICVIPEYKAFFTALLLLLVFSSLFLYIVPSWNAPLRLCCYPIYWCCLSVVCAMSLWFLMLNMTDATQTEFKTRIMRKEKGITNKHNIVRWLFCFLHPSHVERVNNEKKRQQQQPQTCSMFRVKEKKKKTNATNINLNEMERQTKNQIGSSVHTFA